MNIPRHIGLKIMEESPTFREFIFDLSTGQHDSPFREKLKEELDALKGDKLAQIKHVRQASKDNPVQFESAFSIPIFGNCLSLVEAKRFVEERY